MDTMFWSEWGGVVDAALLWALAAVALGVMLDVPWFRRSGWAGAPAVPVAARVVVVAALTAVLPVVVVVWTAWEVGLLAADGAREVHRRTR